MGKVLSMINFKGGVGKTTLSVNVAACLAAPGHGKKVLLIDLDPQSNSSIWLLGQKKWKLLNKREEIKNTSYSLFFGKFDFASIKTPYDSPATNNWLPFLKVLPASFHMVKLEDKIFTITGMRKLDGSYKKWEEYQFLEKHLGALKEKYDYIIIDCPPNVYTVTRNALCYSDYIVVPSTPDSLSTMGLRLLLHELDNVVKPLVAAQVLSCVPQVLGVVIMRLKPILTEHKTGVQVMAAALDFFKRSETSLLFDRNTTVYERQPVKDYVAHQEAVKASRPLCLNGPETKAYADIVSVTKALLASMEGL